MNKTIDDKTLVLASASPRRYELLSQLNLQFEVYVADADESISIGERAEDYVQRIALSKARLGFDIYGSGHAVIGADTCIESNGEILLKPISEDDAARLLHRLSGDTHTVHTAVAIACQEGERVLICKSDVTFARLESSDIAAYIQTGEPLDKAGAYAIQGIAAQFIIRLEGSYSGVMGLPLYETCQLLNWCGLRTI